MCRARSPATIGSLPVANPLRLGRARLLRPLERIGRKSHHVTTAQPYNPLSVAATQPRGFVQQGLSARRPVGAHTDHRRSADETLFVRRILDEPRGVSLVLLVVWAGCSPVPAARPVSVEWENADAVGSKDKDAILKLARRLGIRNRAASRLRRGCRQAVNSCGSNRSWLSMGTGEPGVNSGCVVKIGGSASGCRASRGAEKGGG